MTADFLNELNSITKTKEEYEQEEKQKAKKRILEEEEKWRKNLIFRVKNDIKEKASKGDFEIVGNKKRACGFIDYGGAGLFLASDVKSSPEPYVNHEELLTFNPFVISKWKTSVKPNFLLQIGLTKKDLEKEGLIVLKFLPAFSHEPNKKVIANEIIYTSNQKVWFTRPRLYVYYEIEY